LKIYDENEEDVDPENILENTKLMTILEIQGIKCSSRSFQIEYEIKQMMKLNPVDIFEKCLFTVKKKVDDSSSKEKNDLGKLNNDMIQPILEDIVENESIIEFKNSKNEVLDEKKDLAKIAETEVETEPKIETAETTNMDFCEIDLVITENNEEDTLKLKNRNTVYFEMYREAKKKAKLARDFALSAYLEAKRIKNTYLMDETFVSDDENDLEEKSLENVF
jgi:hypothetical protein